MKPRSLLLKFGLLVGIAMAVSLAVAVIAVASVHRSLQEVERVGREDFRVQQGILRATVSFKVQVQEWKNVLLRGRDPAQLDRYWGQFRQAESETVAGVREAVAATTKASIREKLEQFLGLHEAAGARYRAGLDAFKAAGMDPHAGDRAVAGVDRPPTEALLEAQRLAAAHGTADVGNAMQSANRGYRIAVVGMTLAMVAALAVLLFYFRRGVIEPIAEAVRVAGRIARGDLTGEIRAASSRDEAGQLLEALAAMQRALVEVVLRVRESAEQVVTASGQVAAGTTDLSQRTEEQASSLQETAASMEELASTVKQNADNAARADELARGASRRAEQGGSEVVKVVTTMAGISDSARRISDIISVIDAIAFQTNILALNAAVEAARAGEQGRGFAVVAAEVRSLAQRSAQAAREIKDLIGTSVQKVDAGRDLVESAGDTIQALVIDVQRVSELMRSIAEASAEQSRGVQQVNRTVTEMDKVVQQNASAVQQSASAAAGMRHQAEALVAAVSQFRLSAAYRASQPVAGGTAARAAGAFPEAPRGPAQETKTLAAPRGGDDWEEF